MTITGLFGRIVAMVGAAMILLRRQDGDALPQAFGTSPTIPEAKPQGIPTLKMPTAKGWVAGTGAGGGTRPQGQRLRHRAQAPARTARAAQWRRAGGRSP